MDLDRGVRVGRNGSVRALHRLHRALAAAVGAGRTGRTEPFELTDISRRLLERMAVDDYFVGGARDGDAGWIRAGVLPQANTPRFRAGAGAGRILRSPVAAARVSCGFGDAPC